MFGNEGLPSYPPMPESIHYTIQPLQDIELLRQCVDVQRKAWGFSDEDLLPVRVLVVCTKIGGQVLGALDAHGKVVGFVNAFPGVRDNKVYLHSQMMGVLPVYQNFGIGRGLKLAQREEALRRGIQRIEWTFDPLEIRNAHFNLEILGVICRKLYVNTYGITSSHLQAGLPTDRLVAEWHLESARVRSRIRAHSLKPTQPSEIVPFTVNPFRPMGAREENSEYTASCFCTEETAENRAKTVELPSNMNQLKSVDSETSLKLQLEFRQQMLNLLERDYCVTKFEVDRGNQRARYHLEPYDEKLVEP
jgi:predicted GNAT superfamily acetyltransferase